MLIRDLDVDGRDRGGLAQDDEGVCVFHWHGPDGDCPFDGRPCALGWPLRAADGVEVTDG